MDSLWGNVFVNKHLKSNCQARRKSLDSGQKFEPNCTMFMNWALFCACVAITVSGIWCHPDSDSFQRTSIDILKEPPVRQTRSTKVSFNDPGCGSQNKVGIRNKRIIGGLPAAAGEWPWMAMLHITSWDRTCGAVLITSQHVLTAAHCVRRTYVSLDVADVIVRLGALDLRLRNQNERNFTVETVLVHEDYNKTSLEHDLALVKLTTKVDYTDIIHPICIPDKTLSTELKSAFAAGWGRTVPKGPVSNILQKVQVTVVQHVQCKAIYKSLKRNIFDSQLCAGDKDGTKDTCQGDSGGPLMIKNDSKQWQLIGIVSFGHGCAEYLKPGIYTRVTYYLEWIIQHLNPVIRIGCPNGFKNFDESLCVHEYWLNQYKKGALTWDELLEKRENREGLLPIRKTQLKCPGNYVEYDEFYCLTNFLYERYKNGKEQFNNLFTFARSKMSLQPGSSITLPQPSAPEEEPVPYKPVAKRMLAGRISCSETAAAENGIAQITFDEYHCISPDYLENFKSGDIDWYGLQSKKFLKKLPEINRIGCPDGYKNMDEDICIDEYWLEQFKKGALTWNQLLDRRQPNNALIAKRKTELKCPGGHVEFDEFYCLGNFLFNRYLSGKEKWNGLLSFVKNKTSIPTSRLVPAPSEIPRKYTVDRVRNLRDKVPCSTTTAAKHGIKQVKFDEIYCVSPEYIDDFKSGEIEWYYLLSKRFEKMLYEESEYEV